MNVEVRADVFHLGFGIYIGVGLLICLCASVVRGMWETNSRFDAEAMFEDLTLLALLWPLVPFWFCFFYVPRKIGQLLSRRKQKEQEGQDDW